jgi:hypothetical protein
MHERKENSLQTAARWGRNVAVGAVVASAALNLATSVADPIMRNRQRLRRNRHHGSTPVDRETSEENIKELERLVIEFKDRLAQGEDLLDLWIGSDDCSPAHKHPNTGRAIKDDIEDLLDKANVATMDPKRYHEFEAWWDEIYPKGEALLDTWLREDEAKAKTEAAEVRTSGGIWAQERKPNQTRLAWAWGVTAIFFLAFIISYFPAIDTGSARAIVFCHLS